MKKKKKCGFCKKTFPKSKIARINKMWRCIFCKRKKRKEHREDLRRNVLGIRKRADISKEVRERREQREKEGNKYLPSIKSIKYRKITPALGLYLTKVEWQVLNQKYINNGLSSKEAYRKVKGIREYLMDFTQKLRKEKKSEEELSIRFKEEFAKLCET